MSLHPTTQRLVLRSPVLADIAVFVSLLGDYEVAKNMAPIPHPYTDTLFREFLVRTDAARRDGTDFNMAVTRAMDGAFLGMVSVHRQGDASAELGYWYGRPYWGQGYATEAARPMLRFAFEDLDVAAVTSGWFEDNPASGHVLEKLGFEATGAARRRCVSRDREVTVNRMQLTRAQFARKKAA
jgi:[ribosomal protein S5]-alanine N-acetyltransferase